MQEGRIGRLVRVIDGSNEAIGRTVIWMCLILVLVIVTDVGMRYGFGRGSVAMQELQWHLFSLIFLLAAGYTLKHNAHVRVDIFYNRFSPRGQAWIDLLGGLLLLMPFVVITMYTSYDFVAKAWQVREHSVNPGGLPWYPLKTAIPIGFGLLGIQGAAEVLRALFILAGRGPAPAPEPPIPKG
jgi:TRAP-type mannitol/chloroaromatic compound transport system permease small subunit